MNKDDLYDMVISRFNYLYHTDLKDDQVNDLMVNIVDLYQAINVNNI